ncbi:MAG: RNase adapter RapZ [Thermodesulfobacteriota bacterium]
MSADRPSLTIITGLSGAGKSTALNAYEDAGYFCIANLPSFLLPPLLDGLRHREDGPKRLALVMDVRDADFPDAFAMIESQVTACAVRLRLVFLEAAEEVLLRRFGHLRRSHPLAASGLILEGIRAEKEQLAPLRRLANQVIDTSALTPAELAHRLLSEEEASPATMRISVLSFGHKHGLPHEADLMFDARLLPNPFYVPALKDKTGLDPAVAAHALDHPQGSQFLALLVALLDFAIPQYAASGKPYLTIAVGCTGGRHRSVAVAEAIHRHLAAGPWPVRLLHRDMDKR